MYRTRGYLTIQSIGFHDTSVNFNPRRTQKTAGPQVSGNDARLSAWRATPAP